MSPASSPHIPVLLPELLALAPDAKRVVDGTLGDGGHAAALRARGAEVVGIDRDPEALERARLLLSDSGIRLSQGNVFAAEMLEAIGRFAPDLILLDLGVSSRQLDADARGFTFRPGALLDMRMSGEGETAADLLNAAGPAQLATWFRDYADERRAARLAQEIVRRRSRAPLQVSDDLVNAIRAVLGPRSGPGDFARLFQAVRIAVNQEVSR